MLNLHDKAGKGLQCCFGTQNAVHVEYFHGLHESIYTTRLVSWSKVWHSPAYEAKTTVGERILMKIWQAKVAAGYLQSNKGQRHCACNILKAEGIKKQSLAK
eukprot:scaffold175515_cov45-Prasinocladus_malaysianus.AAC.1